MADLYLEGWIDRASVQYLQKVDEIADAVEEMARRIRRDGKVLERAFKDAPPHAQAASDIMHILGWGMANLNLSELIRKAAMADDAPHAVAAIQAQSPEGGTT